MNKSFNEKAACNNNRCPSKKICARFIEEVTESTQWFASFYVGSNEQLCDLFIPTDRFRLRKMLGLDSDKTDA